MAGGLDILGIRKFRRSRVKVGWGLTVKAPGTEKRTTFLSFQESVDTFWATMLFQKLCLQGSISAVVLTDTTCKLDQVSVRN